MRGQSRQHVRQFIGKAQVQQAIGFVQHQAFNCTERQGVVLQEIEQAPRGGDHHIGAAAQCHHLRVDRHATEHHRHFDGLGKRVCQPLQHIAHLSGQFARRHQDERARAARRCHLIGEQALQQGQRKCDGFAGAGLRSGQNILPAEHRRNGCALDGGGHAQAEFGGRVDKGGNESKSGKGH